MIHLHQGFLLRPALRDYGEQVAEPTEGIQNREDLADAKSGTVRDAISKNAFLRVASIMVLIPSTLGIFPVLGLEFWISANE